MLEKQKEQLLNELTEVKNKKEEAEKENEELKKKNEYYEDEIKNHNKNFLS